MPTVHGTSREAIRHNLQEMLRSGRSREEAIAAALGLARESKNQTYQPPVGATTYPQAASQPNAPVEYDFDPGEPRDQSGKWTSGGGSHESGHDSDAPKFRRIGNPDGKLLSKLIYHAATLALKLATSAMAHGHAVAPAVLDTAEDYSNPLAGANASGVPTSHAFMSEFGISPNVAAKIASHALSHGRMAVKKHTGYDATDGVPDYAGLARETLGLIAAIRAAQGDKRPLPSAQEVAERIKYHHQRYLGEGDGGQQQYAALTAEALAAAGDTVHHDASDAQKKAGNYRKGHVTWKGLGITIENAKGSTRKGRDWSQEMRDAYGYIKSTRSDADGDHVDVFVCDEDLDSDIVFVVNQRKVNGRFDEHKCVIGCSNARKAREVYLRNYPDGWRCGPITEMTVQQFKQWLFEGDTGDHIGPAEYDVEQACLLYDAGKFEERKHPRDHGKFSSKPGESSSKPDTSSTNGKAPDLKEYEQPLWDTVKKRAKQLGIGAGVLGAAVLAYLYRKHLIQKGREAKVGSVQWRKKEAERWRRYAGPAASARIAALPTLEKVRTLETPTRDTRAMDAARRAAIAKLGTSGSMGPALADMLESLRAHQARAKGAAGVAADYLEEHGEPEAEQLRKHFGYDLAEAALEYACLTYAGEWEEGKHPRDKEGEFTEGTGTPKKAGAPKGNLKFGGSLKDGMNAIIKKHNDEVKPSGYRPDPLGVEMVDDDGTRATDKPAGPSRGQKLQEIAETAAAEHIIHRATSHLVNHLSGTAAGSAEHVAITATAGEAAEAGGKLAEAAAAELGIAGAATAVGLPAAAVAGIVGGVVAGGFAIWHSAKRVIGAAHTADAKDHRQAIAEAAKGGRAAGLVAARHLAAGKDLKSLRTKNHVLRMGFAAGRQYLIEMAKNSTMPGIVANAVGLWQADGDAIKYAAQEWEESKHPRDHGKFSSKPGASGGGEKAEGKKPESKPVAAPKPEAEPEPAGETAPAEPKEEQALPEHLVPAEALPGLLKTVASQIEPEHRVAMLKAVYKLASLPPKEYRKAAGQAYQKASESHSINEHVYDATAARLIEKWRGSQRAGIVAPVAPNRTMSDKTDAGRLKQAVINQTTAKLARNLASHVRSMPVQRRRLIARQLAARVREHQRLARHHQRQMMRVHGEYYDPTAHAYPIAPPTPPPPGIGDVAAEAGTRAGVEVAASLIEHGLKIYGAKLLHFLTGTGRGGTPRIAGAGSAG